MAEKSFLLLIGISSISCSTAETYFSFQAPFSAVWKSSLWILSSKTRNIFYILTQAICLHVHFISVHNQKGWPTNYKVNEYIYNFKSGERGCFKELINR